LIATLLPLRGDDKKRRALLKRLGGTPRKTTKPKKTPNGRVEDVDAWETVGGVLHWGRESGPDMDWLRDAIRKAFGGRAPRVLDLFAGGGAILLEAPALRVLGINCDIDHDPGEFFGLTCATPRLRDLVRNVLGSPQ
jgi:hypothetical protein